MTLGANTWLYAGVMFLAGIGIPTMAALNAGLGQRLESPIAAACILFALATGVAVLGWLLFDGRTPAARLIQIPWYLFTGGLFVAFYVLSVTHIAPHFGVANAVSFVLLGQLVAMSIIDHVGFAGAPVVAMTPGRAAGLVCMAAGVWLVLNPTTAAR